MYIPNSGEMVVFITAFASVGRLFWRTNTFPAWHLWRHGSLTIGGIIAVLAIATRKELLILILCGSILLWKTYL
jgi:phospho-N-acetylmuramoyl-pentapeptide-transferase